MDTEENVFERFFECVDADSSSSSDSESPDEKPHKPKKTPKTKGKKEKGGKKEKKNKGGKNNKPPKPEVETGTEKRVTCARTQIWKRRKKQRRHVRLSTCLACIWRPSTTRARS